VAEASAAAEADRIEVARMRRELEAKLADVGRKREDLVERTRRELQREIAEVRSRLGEVEGRARTAAQLEEARVEIDRIRQSVRQRTWAAPRQEFELPAPAPEAPLAVGDTVEVKGLEVRAQVEGFTADGRVDLLMGNVRVTLDENEVRKVEGAKAPARPERVSVHATSADELSTVLDLRGVRAHEVDEKVAAFLDRCMLAGLTSARILHGRGTGAVRQAVRDALARHPSAAAFGPADRSAGGDGVTVVDLA
jgi:DNA mismatch repair protein MutS2